MKKKTMLPWKGKKKLLKVGLYVHPYLYIYAVSIAWNWYCRRQFTYAGCFVAGGSGWSMHQPYECVRRFAI